MGKGMVFSINNVESDTIWKKETSSLQQTEKNQFCMENSLNVKAEIMKH